MENYNPSSSFNREIAKSRLSYAKEDDPRAKRILIKTIERLTGRPKIEKLYTSLKQMDLGPQDIWKEALSKLKVYPHYDQAALDRVPKDGPVIFVANHPFGVIDGLMFGLLTSQVRPKFGILVNEVLCTEELFEPYFLPIDFRGTKEALQTIIETRQRTLKRLSEGEAIAIFPSGGVATAKKPFGRAEDLEWKRFVLKLIHRSKATVVPVFFHGQNSHLFQIASKINQNLRLSLLLNEVRNKMGRHIGISIGEPQTYEELIQVGKKDELLHHLHDLTWDLQDDPYYSGFRKKRKGKKLAKQEAKKNN